MALVLGRRLPQGKNQAGESEVCWFAVNFLCSEPCRLCAVRWGVGADGVERHAADGGEGPEETLWQKRADRSQNEGAVPGRDTTLYVSMLLHSDAVNEASSFLLSSVKIYNPNKCTNVIVLLFSAEHLLKRDQECCGGRYLTFFKSHTLSWGRTANRSRSHACLAQADEAVSNLVFRQTRTSLHEVKHFSKKGHKSED